jgi:hypothetical protein
MTIFNGLHRWDWIGHDEANLLGQCLQYELDFKILVSKYRKISILFRQLLPEV